MSDKYGSGGLTFRGDETICWAGNVARGDWDWPTDGRRPDRC